jgi:hypothetical protein
MEESMRRCLTLLCLLLPVVAAAQGVGGGPGVFQSGGPGYFDADPVNRGVWVEEFFSGTTSNGGIGSNGWYSANPTLATDAGVAGHPGVLKNTSSAVNGTVSAIYSTPNYQVQLDDVFKARAIARWGTGANENKKRWGLLTAITTDGATGVFFECLNTDTNWFAVTRNGGASTRTDTGVAFSSTAWPLMEIRPSGTGWAFYLNNSLVATNTTNVPVGTTNVQIAFQQVSTGTAVTLEMDYAELIFDTPARYSYYFTSSYQT